jgi:hypothetical protein
MLLTVRASDSSRASHGLLSGASGTMLFIVNNVLEDDKNER